MGRTLEEIRASRPKIDRARIESTTEEDVRRHAIEDGEDPDAPLTGFVKRRPGQRGPGRKAPMVTMNIRVDEEVLDAWRSRGPGWQKIARHVLAREVRQGGPMAGAEAAPHRDDVSGAITRARAPAPKGKKRA